MCSGIIWVGPYFFNRLFLDPVVWKGNSKLTILTPARTTQSTSIKLVMIGNTRIIDFLQGRAWLNPSEFDHFHSRILMCRNCCYLVTNLLRNACPTRMPNQVMGSVNRNVVPLPNSLSVAICPPCSSTKRLVMAKPIPVPVLS